MGKVRSLTPNEEIAEKEEKFSSYHSECVEVSYVIEGSCRLLCL